jgi:hypothetical protein
MTATICNVCVVLKKKETSHDSGGCKYASYVLCERCHVRGHFTRHCEEPWSHWERPATYEEMIPAADKLRYNINTNTYISYTSPRGGDDTEQEHSHGNTHVITDEYPELGIFMKNHKIKPADDKVTKDKYISRVSAIKAWATEQGCRIILQHVITSV